jgi:hypothetical protein
MSEDFMVIASLQCPINIPYPIIVNITILVQYDEQVEPQYTVTL